MLPVTVLIISLELSFKIYVQTPFKHTSLEIYKIPVKNLV